jgi:trehalose/maltose hydrolase-like predicted phosphorylase
VTAGRRGDFAVVIGVNRRDVASALEGAGADLVVRDLGEVVLQGLGPATDGWHLFDDGSDPEQEGVREALYGLGNGYIATRGACTYARDDSIHYPGTYFAGVYDRQASSIDGTVVEEETIVNAPNWLPLTFRADGGSNVDTGGVLVSGHRLRLDLRRGLLERRYEVHQGDKRTSVLERRIVSMADPHLAAVEVTVVAENWSGTIDLVSGLDGEVTDSETVEERLLANRHLEVVAKGEERPSLIWLAARTLQSGIVLAEAARSHVTGEQVERHTVSTESSVAHHFAAQIAEQGRVTIEKVVAFHTSRDHAISEPTSAARGAARRAPAFDELLTRHVEAWERLWRRADVDFDDEHHEFQAIIRFHLFHVLQVTSPHVEAQDSGIPARGLHGEGYLGHIFWDELFVFPLLNLRFPDVARALLTYRSRRLGAARRAAAESHFGGAMYPWQSGSDGRDETPHVLFNARSAHWMPDDSRYQRHVGLAVAYNAWQYWQATADHRYLIDHGAEVMLEVARHFASRATLDTSLGKFRIRGVMGPDEFHDGYPGSDKPGIDDNAYTNVMTAWLLARSIELADFLVRSGNQEVLERVDCGATELAHFDRLSRSIFVPFSDGIMAQFDGFERLEPIDLEAYRTRYGNIGRLDLILEAEGDTVRRYQVAKQPDTLMLLYLLSAEELRTVLERLGYSLSPEAIRRTVQYYEGRVTHGSSLSQVVHAWVAARVDRPSSWRHFAQAVSLDLHDTQGGTTREGIHLGAMAGTVDLLERCYSGLETRADALWLNPCLPAELARLSLVLVYRGHSLSVHIDQHEVRIGVEGMPSSPATIVIQGEPHLLQPGSRIVQALK